MEYLQKQEVRRLLQVAMDHNPEHHLALLTMYATGARVSQVLALTGTHIYSDDSGISKVRIPKAKRGYSRAYEIVKSLNPVTDLTPLINFAKQKGNSKLFGGLTRHYLHLVIKKYAALAGLPVDLIHCHIIRHSTAMRIWNETKSLGAISGFLCHSSPSSAYVYLREHDSSLAENAMKKELEVF